MNERVGLIATVPKSGTWYTTLFLVSYASLLRDRGKEGAEFNMAATIQRHPHLNNIFPFPEYLRLSTLAIYHAVCPGFKDSVSGKSQAWCDLEMTYGPAKELLCELFLRRRCLYHVLNPEKNPGARIVHLFRNPLDQFVSCYNQDVVRHEKYQGIPVSDWPTLRDKVFAGGYLDSYIKRFYSFKQMQLEYPENILLLSYEEITQNPSNAFMRMLSFLGAQPRDEFEERVFQEALLLSQIKSVLKTEEELGRSIAGAHAGSSSHIASGKIGQWKQKFNYADIEKIESRLNEFNLSLNFFQTDEDVQKRLFNSECFLGSQALQAQDRIRSLEGQIDQARVKLLNESKVSAFNACVYRPLASFCIRLSSKVLRALLPRSMQL